MDMQVQHRLAGSGSIINADIEAFGMMRLQQQFARLGQEIEECHLLVSGCLKNGDDVALRHDQGMAGGDGKGVGYGPGIIVRQEDCCLVRVAEGAAFCLIIGYR